VLKGKQPTTKNTLSSMAIFQMEGEFHRQTKDHHLLNLPYKKYERDFFKLKRKGTKNKKTWESKDLTPKGKYIVKVVN